MILTAAPIIFVNKDIVTYKEVRILPQTKVSTVFMDPNTRFVLSENTGKWIITLSWVDKNQMNLFDVGSEYEISMLVQGIGNDKSFKTILEEKIDNYKESELTFVGEKV